MDSQLLLAVDMLEAQKALAELQEQNQRELVSKYGEAGAQKVNDEIKDLYARLKAKQPVVPKQNTALPMYAFAMEKAFEAEANLANLRNEIGEDKANEIDAQIAAAADKKLEKKDNQVNCCRLF